MGSDRENKNTDIVGSGTDRVPPRSTNWPPAWLRKREPITTVEDTPVSDISATVVSPPTPADADTITVAPPVVEIDPAAVMLPADFAYAYGPRPHPEPCPWCGGRLRHNPLCVVLTWLPVLRFGRHRGKRLDEVPKDYLQWLLRRGEHLSVELREDIRRFLGTEAGK
jgi:hypothetical protein